MTLNDVLDALTAWLSRHIEFRHVQRFKGEFAQQDLGRISFETPALFVIVPRSETRCPQAGTLDWHCELNLLVITSGEDRERTAIGLSELLFRRLDGQRYGLAADRLAAPQFLGDMDVTDERWDAQGVSARILVLRQTIRTGPARPGLAFTLF